MQRKEGESISMRKRKQHHTWRGEQQQTNNKTLANAKKKKNMNIKWKEEAKKGATQAWLVSHFVLVLGLF
jgi:hypothetical protein